MMRLGYADPPYPGCAEKYRNHPDYAGEVDHTELIARLETEFDGWVLHTSSVALGIILPLIPQDARVMAWVKSFAAFKRNVSIAYAWEPVIIKAARKPVVSKRLIMRDWVECPITLRRGLCGAKPEKVCHWAFEMLGSRPDDDLIDLYPGTGAVTRAWQSWCGLFLLPESDFAPALPVRPTTEDEGRLKRVQSVIEAVESEPLRTGEPAESIQLGRLQVCDEIHAVLAAADGREP